MDWESVLQEARSARDEEASASSSASSLLSSLEAYFAPWKEQLEIYASLIGSTRKSKEQPSMSNKEIVLGCRAALRFGICCMSIPDDEARSRFQDKAVAEYGWHRVLSMILSQERGDVKCRLLCAQLLSNLSTTNFATAYQILSEISTEPSQEEISAKVIEHVADKSQGIDKNLDENVYISPNWVDIILLGSRSGNREVLAASIAAIHNCIASLIGSDPDDSRDPTILIDKCANSSLLVSNVIRQLISSGSVEKMLPSKAAVEVEDAELADSATDWICLLLLQLVGLGKFPQMYKSIRGHQHGNEAKSLLPMILPEQLVLLHCIAKEAVDPSSSPVPGSETNIVLGGQAGWDSICFSISYLTEIFSEIHGNLFSNDAGALELAHSATIAILDIVCSTISDDGDLVKELRLFIGSDTQLLPEASQVLGRMVDILAKRSVGKKTRELKMSQHEQQLTTGLVRLVANLCYRCQPNQDLLRGISVPPSNVPNTDQASPPMERNALHVLLSATSYATACFTLREWSVIAIRNALHENPLNQKVVADLEAQQPVQTAALAGAGVRVNMDSAGKVTLKPVSEDEQE